MCASILAAVLAVSPLAGADTPAQLSRKARKEEKAGHFAAAYLLYSQAAANAPGVQKYASRAEALQGRAAQQSPPQLTGGAAPVTPTVSLEDAFDNLTQRDFAAARQPRPPVDLQAKPGPQAIHLFLNAQQLFEQVTRQYGLDLVFDSDYPAGTPLHFDLEGADYRDALHSLEAVTSSFVVPLGPKLVLVAKDTPAKRSDLEQTATASVPLPSTLQAQELVEIAQAVRQAVGVEKIAWDSQSNLIVIRDRVSRVRAAQAVLHDLLQYRAQIIADVEFLQVNESDLTTIGIDWQAVLPVTYLGRVLRSRPNISSSLGLLTFGGGKTMFGIGVLNPTIYATLSESASRQLLRTQLRSTDGQPATLHIGDKYPVLTSGYFGTSAVVAGGSSYRPPPAYTFEDLGISVKITPHVHGMQETTLDLDSEFEVLGGAGFNGIPIISHRKLATTIRLRNDQWAVIAGLVNEGVSKTWTSVWGLGHLPVIGPLFRKYARDKEVHHVLIAIRPRLLGIPPDQAITRAVRVGTETRSVTPL